MYRIKRVFSLLFAMHVILFITTLCFLRMSTCKEKAGKVPFFFIEIFLIHRSVNFVRCLLWVWSELKWRRRRRKKCIMQNYPTSHFRLISHSKVNLHIKIINEYVSFHSLQEEDKKKQKSTSRQRPRPWSPWRNLGKHLIRGKEDLSIWSLSQIPLNESRQGGKKEQLFRKVLLSSLSIRGLTQMPELFNKQSFSDTLSIEEGEKMGKGGWVRRHRKRKSF